MNTDFVAVDFETANSFRGSPCAVGAVKVVDGRIAEEWSTLIRPPAEVRGFDRRNVRIHGIRPEDIAAAPHFSEVLVRLREFVGTLPVAAHNAAFDMGVIRSAAEVEGLPLAPQMYFCTVQLSRKHFTLPSHSLPFSAEAAGAPMTHHHDALEDARACAAIAAEVLRHADGPTLAEGLAQIGVPLSVMPAYDPSEGRSASTEQALAALGPAEGPWVTAPLEEDDDERPGPVTPAADADPGNPLYGQRILFTGRLGISRAEAWRRAAAAGAQPVPMLTATTTTLVVGIGFSHESLAAGAEKTRPLTQTLEKVLRLQSRGLDIEIVTEGEFMQRVGGSWPRGAH